MVYAGGVGGTASSRVSRMVLLQGANARPAGAGDRFRAAWTSPRLRYEAIRPSGSIMVQSFVMS